MMMIPVGTKVRAIRAAREWHSGNFTGFTTTKQHLFDKHEVVVDPVGRLGCHRGCKRTIGGAYAEAGYYGFQLGDDLSWKGWALGVLLVRADAVQYLN